jgi:glycosyltransferase involved in cell wall biosynthesis
MSTQMARARERLELLYVTLFPPSPARYGAQRRIQGLMEGFSRRHDVTAVSLLPTEIDPDEARQAMSAYCREIILVPAPGPGRFKRLGQARSLLSLRSYERHLSDVPELRQVLHRMLTSRPFDIVQIEAPQLAQLRLTHAPNGARAPLRVADQHNIEFDLVRQSIAPGMDLPRRVYSAVNYPKVRREEMAVWRQFDGVLFTSSVDEARARALVPSVQSAIIPNAVDVRYFQRSPSHPPPDGRTLMFFGAIDYFPNTDGLRFFLRDVWPLVSQSHPAARLKIVGLRPTPDVLAARGPRVEVTGVVDDLRPHLAEAEMVIAPLRVGGGTRFKILEAMAMSKPIVSTAIGAEGIDVVDGESILLANTPADFAARIGKLLDDRELGRRLGERGRALVEDRYSWEAITARLEGFFRKLLDRPERPDRG